VDRATAAIIEKLSLGAVSVCEMRTRGEGFTLDAPAITKVREMFRNKELWLAAVLLALKMCEAESELDISVQDLVLPLARFGREGLQCTSERWKQVLKYELYIMNNLNFRLHVVSPFQFVEHLALRMCKATYQGEDSGWEGFEKVSLPHLSGPPLKSCKLEDKQSRLSLPLLQITKVQALAHFLLELMVAHDPAQVYSTFVPLPAVSMVALELALSSFASPPEACRLFLDAQKANLSDFERTPALNSVETAIQKLWHQPPKDSQVLQKWSARCSDLIGLLPAVSSEAPEHQNFWSKFLAGSQTPDRSTEPFGGRATSFANSLLGRSTPTAIQPTHSKIEDANFTMEPQADTPRKSELSLDKRTDPLTSFTPAAPVHTKVELSPLKKRRGTLQSYAVGSPRLRITIFPFRRVRTKAVIPRTSSPSGRAKIEGDASMSVLLV